ncbi:MAG: RNA-binding protein [Gammaproteobacteria bacterium]|jgi:RNA recognition motif-containing protein|nr:RNA-binding protein [Gammaproteobacteria bacterium]MBT3858244.1 RNA-binding protein [Gammaproteobacteria bacterium]MBT3988633.1 RNA-binding protein [Gammaproteobacteria bacterium]MBT4256488.1 RNA-binding protein [Gammaproteobacteria bacterium]MBT4580429.1 RNA-binding protein [Gammaproteobacteria bacterium]
MKLLVRNLSRDTTEAELQAAFEAHGTVQSTSLVLDKKTGGSKGFAFVDMPKAGQAKAAMKHLNGNMLDDRKIRVKKAENREKKEDD